MGDADDLAAALEFPARDAAAREAVSDAGMAEQIARMFRPAAGVATSRRCSGRRTASLKVEAETPRSVAAPQKERARATAARRRDRPDWARPLCEVLYRPCGYEQVIMPL
jgi:hypothetical protein